MNTKTFAELELIAPICRALATENYETPTPIQAQSIPHVLSGGDILGCAQTGTGKTAAFSLPILQRLSANPKPLKKHQTRTLVLAPTRELAIQIGDSIKTYGRHLNLRHTVIFGGVSQMHQSKAMGRGVDILVATPGRLLDLMNQRIVDLRHLEILVLDEADRMLDMGFIRDIKKILAVIPKKRQTLFFSATMPKEVSALAGGILKNPKYVEVARVSSTAEGVEEQLCFVSRQDKLPLLVKTLNEQAVSRMLIFTQTKHAANRLAQTLTKKKINAEAIHGNKSQGARQRALKRFKDGDATVLVATDIVARGIDVDDISHVVNYQLSREPESYVHRIGRTARAGASGLALTFCDTEERPLLYGIEKMLNRSIPVNDEHDFHCEDTRQAYETGGRLNLAKPKGKPRTGRRRSGGSRRAPQAGARRGSNRRRARAR